VSDKGSSALFSVLAIAPDSRSFVVGDQDGVLHVWNLDSKSETRAVSSPDVTGKMVVELVFSADGKILVAIHRGKKLTDGTAVVWNTTDWTSHTLSGYTAAAFSRDGRLRWVDPTSNSSTPLRVKNFAASKFPCLPREKFYPIPPVVLTLAKNFPAESPLLRSPRTAKPWPSAVLTPFT